MPTKALTKTQLRVLRTPTQLRALQEFVTHVVSTNLGFKTYLGVERSGPINNRTLPTWNALRKLDLLKEDGRSTSTAGHFSWTMPCYRITEAGLAILAEHYLMELQKEACAQGDEGGDLFCKHKPVCWHPDPDGPLPMCEEHRCVDDMDVYAFMKRPLPLDRNVPRSVGGGSQ